MDDASSRRFASAAKQMEEHGFSDTPKKKASTLSAPASETFNQLLHSVRRLAATISNR
jgi:hypothetical protein